MSPALVSLLVLLQELTCTPHPPHVGQTAAVRCRDAAGVPVPGIIVTVEQKAAGGRPEPLSPTDAKGETAWTPATAGTHVLSAKLEPPRTVTLLLGVDVAPAPSPLGYRVALAVVGLALVVLNLRAMLVRRVRTERPPAADLAPRAPP